MGKKRKQATIEDWIARPEPVAPVSATESETSEQHDLCLGDVVVPKSSSLVDWDWFDDDFEPVPLPEKCSIAQLLNQLPTRTNRLFLRLGHERMAKPLLFGAT
jgi:hypothetical protein